MQTSRYEGSETDSFRAFANGMMRVQRQFLGRIDSGKKLNPKDLEERLVINSQLKCLQASASLVGHLFSEYPHLFDRFLLLQGTSSMYPAKRFSRHYYAVVRDHQGVFLTASPANHQAGSTESPLVTFLASKDPHYIYQKIRQRDGGDWYHLANLGVSQQYADPVIRIRKDETVELDLTTARWDVEGQYLTYAKVEVALPL